MCAQWSLWTIIFCSVAVVVDLLSTWCSLVLHVISYHVMSCHVISCVPMIHLLFFVFLHSHVFLCIFDPNMMTWHDKKTYDVYMIWPINMPANTLHTYTHIHPKDDHQHHMHTQTWFMWDLNQIPNNLPLDYWQPTWYWKIHYIHSHPQLNNDKHKKAP